jgi:hypothetical protein
VLNVLGPESPKNKMDRKCTEMKGVEMKFSDFLGVA